MAYKFMSAKYCDMLLQADISDVAHMDKNNCPKWFLQLNCFPTKQLCDALTQPGLRTSWFLKATLRKGKKHEPWGQFSRALVNRTPYLKNSLFCSPCTAQLRFVRETQCFNFLSFMDCRWVRFIFTVSCLLTCGKDSCKRHCAAFPKGKCQKGASPSHLLHCPHKPLLDTSVLARVVSRKRRKMWRELREKSVFFLPLDSWS